MDVSLSEKEAEAYFLAGAESVSGLLKEALGLDDIPNFFKKLWGAGKEYMHLVGTGGLLGAAVGSAAGFGYDAIKERMSQVSQEEKDNMAREALFYIQNKELEDAKWMRKAREQRDNLKRNKNKKTPEEYAKNYQELLDTLKERSM